MAGISYTTASAQVNPTSRVIPVNGNGIFVDSNINNVVDTSLQTIVAGVQDGINLDFNSGRHYIGDAVLNITMDTSNFEFNFVGPAAAIESNISSGNSGNHLVVHINGMQYKIKLENP